MNAPDDIEHLLRDLEREGLVLHLGIGDATVWFATEFRERMIAERLAMLPDEPLVSVATAAAVLNVPHSHVIAEVRAATLAGHDSGRRIWVRREALVRRITTLGLPLSAPRPARPNSLGDSTPSRAPVSERARDAFHAGTPSVTGHHLGDGQEAPGEE